MVEIDHQKLDDWKINFEGFAVEDIRKSIQLDENLEDKSSNIGVGLILLTFMAVESLSGYSAGQTANDVTAKQFIREYFPDKYKGFVEEIWLLRNSLAHDYAIDHEPGRKTIVMFHYPHEPHLECCQNNSGKYLSFSRSIFAQDFLAVWEEYLKKVSSEKEVYRKWEKRVNHQRGYLRLIPKPCNENDWEEQCDS